MPLSITHSVITIHLFHSNTCYKYYAIFILENGRSQ